MNEQKNLDDILINIRKESRTPRLFLHSCCAPCSSYVLEYLSEYFEITDYFYNPNITSEAEYRKRSDELQRLIASMPLKNKVHFTEGKYEPRLFFQNVKGLEACPEGHERCFKCFELRLRRTAELAEKEHFDYFATTLTISPLKNAAKINEIGRRLEKEYNVRWLPSDFKKKNGFLRSLQLSEIYGLYRQNYCGCLFSRQEAEKRASDEKKP